jgi:acetyl esterase
MVPSRRRHITLVLDADETFVRHSAAMPLDPQCRALLDEIAPPGAPGLHELPLPELRQSLATMFGVFAGPVPEVARVEDRRIPGPAGEVPVRVYTPAGRAPFPALVYLHGGGWVLGSLESHDATCRALARDVPCVVVAVDYRLAPEHRFPAAAEDAYAAVRQVAARPADFGVDPARLAVGGDSAGGNLSAVVALMARDRGGPRLVHQLLVYPVADGGMDTPSFRENAEGYFLTRDAMVWFWNHYAPDAAARANPYASPLRASDLRGLPPALVQTAEFDPLRDEGEAYAARLREAGVSVTLTRYAGMIHGFVSMPGRIDRARDALAEAVGALRAAFA